MAARLNTRQADSVRAQIKGVQIAKRLQDHVDGKLDLTPTQAQVGLTLLSYVLPKPVQTVEQTGSVVLKWQ
jgi:hypothetical protein